METTHGTSMGENMANLVKVVNRNLFWIAVYIYILIVRFPKY